LSTAPPSAAKARLKKIGTKTVKFAGPVPCTTLEGGDFRHFWNQTNTAATTGGLGTAQTPDYVQSIALLALAYFFLALETLEDTAGRIQRHVNDLHRLQLLMQRLMLIK
jgi:hypothetical protein